jgi:diacylglycerol kinase (ATP)
LTVAGSNGWTALHHAARLGKYEIVQYLVQHLPKEALDLVENEKLQTPLHKAAWYGYFDICKVLVESGASLYRQDYQGNTAMVQARRSGDEELMKYFKEKESSRQQSLDDEEQAI